MGNFKHAALPPLGTAPHATPAAYTPQIQKIMPNFMLFCYSTNNNETAEILATLSTCRVYYSCVMVHYAS